MNDLASPPTLSETFNNSPSQAKKRKRPAPFSLRLSEDERAYLDAKAGSRPLGSYIRNQLLGDKVEKRRSQRKPSVDEKLAAELLTELQQTRIANNLNQIAKAANCGTLDTTEEVEQQLADAYACVMEMRKALFMALGLRLGVDISSSKAVEDE